jgi:hypothetical protein
LLATIINLDNWLTDTILITVLLFVGLDIIWKAKKKDMKGVAEVGGCLFAGLFVIGLGSVPGALQSIETFLVDAVLSIIHA